ncbi:MAG: DUF2783 domain-containing protein [Gammaproteobacteria bacterium]
MSKQLTTEALERIYDQLAEVVDKAGPEKEALLLSKLCLLLAQQLGDEETIRECIDIAARDLS